MHFLVLGDKKDGNLLKLNTVDSICLIAKYSY